MKKYKIEVRKRIAPGRTQYPYIAEAYAAAKNGSFLAACGGQTPEEAKRKLLNTLESESELVEQTFITIGEDEPLFELIKVTLLNARVCSNRSWEETLEWLQINHPAGTDNNWQKAKGKSFAPLTCQDHPERTHYMFDC